MLRIVKRLLRIAGPNGKRLKLSFGISFIYSILESLPTCALFAMFNGLCSPNGVTKQLLYGPISICRISKVVSEVYCPSATGGNGVLHFL